MKNRLNWSQEQQKSFKAEMWSHGNFIRYSEVKESYQKSFSKQCNNKPPYITKTTMKYFDWKHFMYHFQLSIAVSRFKKKFPIKRLHRLENREIFFNTFYLENFASYEKVTMDLSLFITNLSTVAGTSTLVAQRDD